jgi:hypothetical protein
MLNDRDEITWNLKYKIYAEKPSLKTSNFSLYFSGFLVLDGWT